MSDIKFQEFSYELEYKDYITSLDSYENLILITSFRGRMDLFKILEDSEEVEAKLINNINFDSPIMDAKFFSTNSEILVLFCHIYEDPLENNLDHTLSAIRLNQVEEGENIEMGKLFSFKTPIISFSIFNMENINFQVTENLILVELEKNLFLLQINDQLSTPDFQNDTDSQKNIFESLNLIHLDTLSLGSLSKIKICLLESIKLLVIACIEYEEFDVNDEEKNETENFDFQNMIYFYDLRNKNFKNLIKKIKSPLEEITYSICKLNETSFAIGSIEGRISVFDDIEVEVENTIKNFDYKFYNFKAHQSIFNQDKIKFPINCLSANQEKGIYATGGSNRRLNVFDFITKKRIYKKQNLENSVSKSIFSHDGKFLIFICSYLFEDYFSEIPPEDIFHNTNFSFDGKPEDDDNLKEEIIKKSLNEVAIDIDEIQTKDANLINKLYIIKLN